MEYRNIFIARPGRVSVRNNQLVIEQDSGCVAIPVEDISSVMVESNQISITSFALSELALNGVTVFFCDSKHMPVSQILPINQYSRQRKMLKIQMELGKPLKKRLWQSIVRAKITNQALCLKLLGKKGEDELFEMSEMVTSDDSGNIEAAAAAVYFPKLFGDGFSRGSECAINSALNYGYAIIRGAIARNLVVHGLEPCLGIHHRSELNNFNLADDLIEPFRPLVDMFVAIQDWNNADLLPNQKQSLFNITNCLVKQAGSRYRVMSAVGRSVISLVRSMKEGKNLIELMELIPLEWHQYE